MRKLKTIIIIVISALFCIACQSERKKTEKNSLNEIHGKKIPLETKYKLVYEENTDKLADGTYLKESGKYLWVERYINGLADGRHEYYEGNRLVSFETFKNGLRHGELTKYWENGKPLLTHFYSDDLIDSTHYYFKSGKIKERIIFDEYAYRIQWLIYNESGDVVEERD